ncbi:DUF1810 domain-containing protein [Actinoplanes sp. CA-030573]|uniref:DUF1810 domain-containing protein n=1 Tax=Actinoplanes sp. CA-030573 TaxID=3239898 RepID=UPI003D8F7823
MADLERFVAAQQGVYERALAEIEAGQKRTHWMWFIFPQIAGLGSSPTARQYAIRDRAEAVAYLAHPVLGPRLRECAAAALKSHTTFGYPDDLKLRSSMTLFAEIDPSPFAEVRDVMCGGADPRTLDLLHRDKTEQSG